MSKKLYDKLIRDKIPSIIEKEGKTLKTRKVGKTEKIGYLLDKILEETEEIRDVLSLEEIADLQEVIDSLIDNLGYTKEEVREVQDRKREERGSFNDGIVLLEVDD